MAVALCAREKAPGYQSIKQRSIGFANVKGMTSAT